jgi:cobyrinic acid a,c-diamide synthase
VIAVAPAVLLVSAAGTGAGKTLVSLALARALRAAGYRTRSYKTGPDYIDARLATFALGEPAHNLDAWLDTPAGVRRHVAATCGDADVCIVEGMMGLFDGDNAGTTSTATIARVLDASVVSVIDCWTSSQTAAAVAFGLRAFDASLAHAGIILNRVGGAAHADAIRAACGRVGIRVLGSIPHDPAFAVGERRLGLDAQAFERRAEIVHAMAAVVAESLDLHALVAGCRRATLTADDVVTRGVRTRIAYAHDDAFWFTYPETLDALRAAGAELVPFSPLADTTVPSDVGALWIGGGYPEEHAARLAENASMRASIRDAAAAGLPTYAECGGLMYLAEELQTADGAFPMVGALPGSTSIAEPRLHIGYRTARVVTTSPLDAAGTEVRGYEFHYATSAVASDAPAYAFEARSDGAVCGACVGAFLHRHFIPGDPAIARFVDAAEAFAGTIAKSAT